MRAPTAFPRTSRHNLLQGEFKYICRKKFLSVQNIDKVPVVMETRCEVGLHDPIWSPVKHPLPLIGLGTESSDLSLTLFWHVNTTCPSPEDMCYVLFMLTVLLQCRTVFKTLNLEHVDSLNSLICQVHSQQKDIESLDTHTECV